MNFSSSKTLVPNSETRDMSIE